ncbi:MAG: DsbA family protein [Chloroflexales bacterium]|nr:DsbA family protein [Chloroflexales bacterium]
MPAIKLTVYFDFLCPFAYRASLWLAQVQEHLDNDLAITWKYFPLEQINTPSDSDWKLWEQDEHYTGHNSRPELRALLAFWGAEAARQQGTDAFARFHRALYHARHEEKLDFSQRANIQQIAARCSLDIDRFNQDFNDRSLLDAIRRDYEEARATYKVFGVPTLCYDADNAIYLELGQVPPPNDALALFHELHRSITSRRWLSEIKRPNP